MPRETAAAPISSWGSSPPLRSTDAPVSLSFPVAVGLSPSNYYNPGGVNHAFGFFSVGASIGVPLNVPEGYGEWGLGLGVSRPRLR